MLCPPAGKFDFFRLVVFFLVMATFHFKHVGKVQIKVLVHANGFIMHALVLCSHVTSEV